MIYRAVRGKMRTHFKRMAECFLGEITLRSFLTLLSNWSGAEGYRGIHLLTSLDVSWELQDRSFSFLVTEKQNLG